MKITRRELIILVVILLFGFVLRISYLSQIYNAPDFSVPMVDAGFHDYWARAIIFGDWTPPEGSKDPQIPSKPYLRPPGYPYFLALNYLLVSGSYLYARVVQICFGLINCVLAWCLGRRIFIPFIGLIFAALMSFYWVFIYYECEFLEPVLLIFLLLLFANLFLLWIETLKLHYLILTSILLGLASLVRANCLLFLPVLIISVIWIVKKRCGFKKAVLSSVFVILAYCTVIAPVTIRNYLADDDFVLISSNLGVNLYIGNNPTAKGEFNLIYVPGEGFFGTSYDYYVVVEYFEKQCGRKLKYSEVSQQLSKMSFEYMKTNPVRTLKLTLKKAYLFWSPRELPHNKYVSDQRELYSALRIVPLNFPVILSLFILGAGSLILDIRSKQKTFSVMRLYSFMLSVFLFFICFVITYYVSYMPFFASALYRVPIIPFLMLFSSYGVYKIYLLIKNRKAIKAIIIVAIGLVLFSLTSVDLYSPVSQIDRYSHGAVICLGNNDLETATDYFQKILDSQPDHAQANYGLGYISCMKNELEQAANYFRKTIEIKPDFAAAHDNLGSVLILMDREEDGIASYLEAIKINKGNLSSDNLAALFVPDYYQYYLYSGSLLARRGQIKDSITLFKMANVIKPDSFETNYLLGKALLQDKQVDEAITSFKNAIVLDPNRPEAFFMFGKALTEMNQFDLAEMYYRRSIELDPNYTEVHRELEGVLLEQGKAVESKKYRKEFLKKQSDEK